MDTTPFFQFIGYLFQSESQLNRQQQELVKTRGFPPPDHSGFGLTDSKLKQEI